MVTFFCVVAVLEDGTEDLTHLAPSTGDVLVPLDCNQGKSNVAPGPWAFAAILCL